MSAVSEVPVLVVGGGPAGATVSILLSRFGIDSLVVEKHGHLSRLPRARGVHARAMEILRSCRLEQEMQSHALEITPGVEWRSTLTRPAARELQVSGPSEVEVSPCDGLAIAQDVFESVLRHALGDDLNRDPGGSGELRLGTELVEVDRTAESVRATLRNEITGDTCEVRARYLVAADGARSPTRRRLGIDMAGPADLGSQLSIAFRADLHRHTGRAPRGLYFLTDSGAALFSTHPDDRWAISVPHVRDRPGAHPHDPSDPAAVVRSATGIADLDVEILVANVWTAAVIEGRAGEALLATYSAEREPVGRRNAELLGAAWTAMLSGAGLAAAPDIRQLDMGYQYASAAITPELDGRVDGAHVDTASPIDGYSPVAAPGCRAPHVWVDQSRDISTIDLIGPDLTLLTAPAGGPWRDAAHNAVPHGCARIALPVVEMPAWPAAYGVEPTGAVLVRPDGHVAWRRRRLPDAPASDIHHELRVAVARSLALANP